ncbi:hypothetical protein MMC06_001366 [Schaereria dolodes]|nr:hypothetical protein [Schaereria dolodes]
MADSPSLTWSSLQHLLENAIPHVLIILDCCFAANAARDTTEGSTKEILAACGRENPTSGVGIRSFTAALLEELQAFGQRPFTVAMLHTRLVTMRWRLAFTPIYALLSEHGGHSIEISPLPIMNIGNPSLLSSHSTSSVSSADPMNLSSSQDDSMFSSSTQPSSQSSPPRTVTNTRVLLAVSIADDAAHDISEWKTWLTTQTPWDVTRVDVRVEAVFESHSTMLLASVPIYAWDILPDRTAYLFVGFIRSGNIQQPHSSSRIASQALKNWGVPVLEMTPSPSEYQRKNPKGRERPKRSSVKGSMVHHNDKESTPTIFSRKRSYQETIVSQVNTEDFTSTPSIASTIRVENSAVEHEPLLGSYDVPDHYSHDTQKDSVNSMMYSNIEVGHQQGKVSTAYVEPSKAYPTPSASANTSANNSANNSSAWSTEDDAQLMRARREGLSWARTAHDYLNAKTANACRKRYERLVKKPNSKEWDPFESETSAKAYIEVREQMWRILADKLGVKWQTVEAQACIAFLEKTNDFL